MLMHFDILTLFPAMFTGPLTESILKRAQQAGLIDITLRDMRPYAADRHKSADDYPFGGGAGMVLKPEVVYLAIMDALGLHDAAQAQPDTLVPLPPERPPVILMSPAGAQFTQRVAEELAQYPRLILVCGHYEGIDERVRAACIDRELSIGDYVLTGGELAAMVVVDAVARLVPQVLASSSTLEESHSDNLLEYPHYTRPAQWRGEGIPDVLVSGHHANIERWRHQQRLLRTLERRPDLLQRATLSQRDQTFLQQHGWQPNNEPS